MRERVVKWYFCNIFYGSFKKWNPKWITKFGKSAWLLLLEAHYFENAHEDKFCSFQNDDREVV